jgi:hypothetical protein
MLELLNGRQFFIGHSLNHESAKLTKLSVISGAIAGSLFWIIPKESNKFAALLRWI